MGSDLVPGGPPRPKLGGSSPSDRERRMAEGSEPSVPSGGTYFLGRYRVVDEIGVGGMASVHLARADGPGGFQKWVAIKRIHRHLAEDEQFIRMFLDEARIAARISHPNVAQVFDLGKQRDTYWIAMEYLHGEPMREIMRAVEEAGAPPMGPQLAAKVIADAAEGLHAAHELRDKDGKLLNLVHRDVTPHNLFLTYDGAVKVVDFGIAKVTGRLSTTRAGTLKGKLAYMSPEQVQGVSIDRRTDIFALGVVLWELTTGRRLFRMDSDLETLERVQACVVPPPSSIVDNYPVELESIVMRALAKDANKRYPSAREMSRALQQYVMRVGAFIGPEETGAYVKQVLSDRYQKREAHLQWAAEVTQTVSLDALEAAQGARGEDGSLLTFESDVQEVPRGPRPAAGATQRASGPTPAASHARAVPAPLPRPPAPAPRPTPAPAPAPRPLPKYEGTSQPEPRICSNQKKTTSWRRPEW
ncbi:MAG: serine/threonine-protein kinase [Polyangiaceae bacterium]